jgi:required for meiotic nuclear division protein 1
MPQLPVVAYGFEARFKMRELTHCFTGARMRVAKTQLVAEYGPDRYALAFDFGAVVFVNVSSEERARVLGEISRRVATSEPHPPLEEDFLLEIDTAAPAHGRVTFDRVILPDITTPTLEVIALLLAQSVAIDYYEEDLQEILKTLERHTSHMSRTGKTLGSRRAIIKFVASTLDAKNQIIAALAVLDKPAATWEKESLDRLYRDFREMLEIGDRYRSLEAKLRTIQESLELFLDIHQARHGHQLETIVVFLILFEIVMALLGQH